VLSLVPGAVTGMIDKTAPELLVQPRLLVTKQCVGAIVRLGDFADCQSITCGSGEMPASFKLVPFACH
jgi:hypothetical protein